MLHTTLDTVTLIKPVHVALFTLNLGENPSFDHFSNSTVVEHSHLTHKVCLLVRIPYKHPENVRIERIEHPDGDDSVPSLFCKTFLIQLFVHVRQYGVVIIVLCPLSRSSSRARSGDSLETPHSLETQAQAQAQALS